MALTNKSIRALKEALPVGTMISILLRNGRKVNDYINDKAFTIGLHGVNDIYYYSDFTMRHHGSIPFSSFDTCSVSKTHVKLDNCVISIKRKARD